MERNFDSKQKISDTKCLSSASKWVKQKEGCPTGVLTSTKDMAPVTGLTHPEFIFQNLHKWENAPAIKCAITGRQYTHGQIYKHCQSFGAALKLAGFERNDCICILLPNVPEYPITAFGSMMAGCIVSPINPAYTKGEIVKHINDCGGKVVITIPQLVPLVETTKPSCPSISGKTIVIGGELLEGCHSFFDMLKTNASGVEFLKGSDINSLDDVCFLPYSSGTTGIPKGVELTHSVLATNIKQICSEEYCLTRYFDGDENQERLVTVLPFFHMYGFHGIMSVALFQGGFISCLPKFEPESYIKALVDHKPTTLHLVTPLINFLANHTKVEPSILSELTGVITAGAPVGKELITKFLSKFGSHICLQEWYGISEATCTHVVPREAHNSKSGSTGIPLPGNTCKIVDVASGKILGPNQSGEICIQSGTLMKGYLNNVKATMNTIDHEKFLHTGDIGYYDEEGYFYIEDRLKDMIKVKGFQVAPSDLEDVMRKHPDIADVAVIGVPHARFGEAPKAYIVRKIDTLSEEVVNEFLKPQLAKHKQLTGGIEFVDVIPKAASGKILKGQLRTSNKC